MSLGPSLESSQNLDMAEEVLRICFGNNISSFPYSSSPAAFLSPGASPWGTSAWLSAQDILPSKALHVGEYTFTHTFHGEVVVSARDDLQSYSTSEPQLRLDRRLVVTQRMWSQSFANYLTPPGLFSASSPAVGTGQSKQTFINPDGVVLYSLHVLGTAAVPGDVECGWGGRGGRWLTSPERHGHRGQDRQTLYERPTVLDL